MVQLKYQQVLEVGQGYLLKNQSNIQTDVSDSLSITGTPVDLTTTINLSAGWNQIAFFNQQLMLI